MRIFCLSLILLNLPAAQDLSGKVRDLIEKMDGDDIAVADEAAADLVKLGPPALSALREQARKRQGDLKLRLEEAIRKIERTEKLSKAVGTEPLVSLHAQDRPIPEILAELARQTGLIIQGESLPAEAKASLNVEKTVLWKAIDELCRSGGRLMYLYTPKRILVRAAPYRDLPRVFNRGFLVFVDQILWTKYADAGDSSFEIQAALVLPPQARPFASHLLVEELEDDKGTNLLQDQGGATSVFSENLEQHPDSSLIPLTYEAPRPPAEDAATLAKFKGKAVLRFALNFRRTVTLKDPLGQPASGERVGKSSVRIRHWKKEGREVVISLTVTAPVKGGEMEDRSRQIVLHDTRGNMILGRLAISRGQTFTLAEPGGLPGEVESTLLDGEMAFTLPEGAEIASLDLVEPAEVEELVIPFDFKGISLN